VARIAHRSCSGPPKTFSPLFSLFCPWIHGLFPAIEFVVAPSSPLPNSGDPGATLARASLSSSDLTAVERSDAARSHMFSLGLISLCPIQIERLGPAWTPLGPVRTPFGPPPSDLDRTAQTPSDPCSRLSAPQSSGAEPARSVRTSPLSLTLPGPPVSARSPTRARPRPQI
jgi:hypothetical protein